MPRARPTPLALQRPGLCALAALALALGAGGCGRAPETAPRHLVLVTVDTWRGDHAFGERAGTALTPRLERFARGGVRFTAADSVATCTSPGVAGILTGLLPFRSGVMLNHHLLSDEVPTLASWARSAGFLTLGVVANPVLRPGMGFEQGFESYRLVPALAPLPKARADAVTDAALASLDAAPDGRRLFLWVHYMDPHGPYSPPEDARRLFPVDAFEAESDIPLLEEPGGLGGIPVYQQLRPGPPSRDGRDYLARYAAEVRFMDRELGRLLDGLEERGLLDDSVVAVTADHGEALAGDHGYYFSHDNGATQDQLHVPLVLACAACPAGSVVEAPVSTVDLAPTLLALLGLRPPSGHALDGVSLLAPEPRPVYGRAGREVSLRTGDWKAVWPFRGGAARLFHLGDDPGELRDLAGLNRDRLRSLAELRRELRGRPVLAEPRKRPEAGGDRARELRALGYL